MTLKCNYILFCKSPFLISKFNCPYTRLSSSFINNLRLINIDSEVHLGHNSGLGHATTTQTSQEHLWLGYVGVVILLGLCLLFSVKKKSRNKR